MAQLAPEGATELSDGRGWPPEMLHQAGQDPPEVGMRQAGDPAHLCLSFPIHHYSSDFKSVTKIQAPRISVLGTEGADSPQPLPHPIGFVQGSGTHSTSTEVGRLL